MWKFIEQPFRNKKIIKKKVFLSLSGLFITIFLSVSFLIQNSFINSYRFVEMKNAYPNIFGNFERNLVQI